MAQQRRCQALYQHITAASSDVKPPRVLSGPLSGIRVVDMSYVISGPFCGSILADQGCDVIKVEGIYKVRVQSSRYMLVAACANLCCQSLLHINLCSADYC